VKQVWISRRTALGYCYEPCSNLIGGRAYVDPVFSGRVCRGAELKGERCWSVWYAISVELRDRGYIRETTIQSKVFAVGDDDRWEGRVVEGCLANVEIDHAVASSGSGI
jgi:hypothetical protein